MLNKFFLCCSLITASTISAHNDHSSVKNREDNLSTNWWKSVTQLENRNGVCYFDQCNVIDLVLVQKILEVTFPRFSRKLCSNPKEIFYKFNLNDWMTFTYTCNLSFTNHMHCLITRNG